MKADKLTHISITSNFRDIGKQRRPGSDSAECGVWSVSSLFANRNIYYSGGGGVTFGSSVGRVLTLYARGAGFEYWSGHELNKPPCQNEDFASNIKVYKIFIRSCTFFILIAKCWLNVFSGIAPCCYHRISSLIHQRQFVSFVLSICNLVETLSRE